MNKNPFVPQPSFTPQQPPLPPGPPPQQPTQQDYSAYWAAQAQGQHVQPPTVGTYNAQWTAPQPPSDQSALYANYGYGGQQNGHWQQQQRQNLAQHQQYQPPPPPPVAQPPPPPPPQPYNPYQPAAGYQQPYVPQGGPAPQPMGVQIPYPQPVPQPHPPQPFFPQHPQQNRQNHNVQHTPPQHLPPAKRQRFDGPSHQRHNQNQQRPPAQPQFQPPPQPMGGGTSMYGPGQAQGPSRGGAPVVNQGSISGPPGRGGAGGGRGGAGVGGGGRGRGGSMSGNRGGMGGRGGRGGSTYTGGGGGGGRGGGGQGGGALRGHGSRGGFGNRDFRRGGSFSAGGGGHSHHQQNSSFRNRGQGHSNSGRGGRHDASGARDGGMALTFTSSGKKDENRRTLTDFKIVGLEIPELEWTWGVLPSAVTLPPSPVKTETQDSIIIAQATQSAGSEDLSSTDGPPDVEKNGIGTEAHMASSSPTMSEVAATDIKPPSVVMQAASGTFVTPPPSRIRIYFHTPVSLVDSQPIPHTSSFSIAQTPSDSRKGKRKKLEDDDGDLEQGRGKRPPPRMGSINDDRSSVAASADIERGSVAPSVAETASESDWLMAAIVGEDGSGGTERDFDSDGDDDKLHVSRIVEPFDTNDDAVGAVGESEYNGNHLPVVDVTMDSEGDNHPNADDDAAGTVNGPVRVDPPSVIHEESSVVVGEHGEGSIADHQIGLENVHSASMEANRADPFLATEAADHKESESPDSHIVTVYNQKCAEGLASAENGPIPFESTSPAVDGTSAYVPDAALGGDQPANSNGSLGTQVRGAPLQQASSIATLPDIEAQDSIVSPFSEDSGTTVVKGGTEDLAADEGYNHMPSASDLELIVSEHHNEHGQEHLPEPPASPTSNTFLSTSSTSTYGEHSQPKASEKAGRIPTANRLSISYAGGSRRLVIDADVISKLKVFRGEGRIEVLMNINKEDESTLKGIFLESLSEATKSYLLLQTLTDSLDMDPTVPPFSKAATPSSFMMIVHLDTQRPLSEPKWVKSGDVQEWLRSMFGRMFWVAGDAAEEGWEKKIEVADPDPAPTIWTVLDGWAVNSPAGQQTERQRFLKTHMTEHDNVLEILLRLVRGERATPFSQSQPTISAPSVSGPLLSAIVPGSAHGAQQTHVSLAVLAMFRMTMEYAKRAVGNDENGKKEVEERVGEIIRCLPSHLIYKSVDGIFKEWRVEKKGSR